jgi:hypothetical protein
MPREIVQALINDAKRSVFIGVIGVSPGKTLQKKMLTLFQHLTQHCCYCLRVYR